MGNTLINREVFNLGDVDSDFSQHLTPRDILEMIKEVKARERELLGDIRRSILKASKYWNSEETQKVVDAFNKIARKQYRNLVITSLS